ncbi:hypothetical protein NPIL_256261 [Nephila pilipes]|uniref:Uncharacterized protein n=1 Tax=Nephila pilipes TaxID=299642 RepID=A0A8X6QKJ0_NEPPI|nr:hypothetical protein NPIL_256261 [Nephila pilipes]
MLNYNIDLSNKSRDKSCENNANDWKEFSHRPRKKAVVNFGLKTRHDCLAEHLKKIGILTNSLCPICKTDTMNRERTLTRLPRPGPNYNLEVIVGTKCRFEDKRSPHRLNMDVGLRTGRAVECSSLS